LKPNSALFGPLLWIQLFFITSYPILSNDDQKNFTYALFNLLPCEICRAHSLTYWTLFIESPKKKETEEKQENFLFEKLLKLHNNIGKEHHKPPRSREEIKLFYHRLCNGKNTFLLEYKMNRFLMFTQK
jgi:hypothetical protein